MSSCSSKHCPVPSLCRCSQTRNATLVSSKLFAAMLPALPASYKLSQAMTGYAGRVRVPTGCPCVRLYPANIFPRADLLPPQGQPCSPLLPARSARGGALRSTACGMRRQTRPVIHGLTARGSCCWCKASGAHPTRAGPLQM